MAFRIEKRALARIAGLILAIPALVAAQDYRYQAWHGHSRPPHIRKAGGMGELTITDAGIAFAEQGSKHAWRWDYRDIQQLKLEPTSLTVLTYKDNRWKLGADRQYRFDLRSGEDFSKAYALLKDRLDQRFVAALPDRAVQAVWEIPVKHLHSFGGSEGVLVFGEDRIVYRTDRPGESRTWRFSDLDNVSTSGPFDLTLTTYERAKTRYASRKDFRFQLKERLEQNRYDELWRGVNRARGLRFIEDYRLSSR